VDRICVPVYNKMPESIKENYYNLIGEIGLDDIEAYIRDIMVSWEVYLLCIATCFVFIFLYNWALKVFAEILAWISIFLVGVGLIALGFFLDFYSDEYVADEDENKKKWLTIFAYTSWVLFVIYLLLICCLYYSIKISIKVLKTSAKIIMKNMRVIIIPLVGMLVVIVWVIFYAYMLLWMFTTGQV